MERALRLSSFMDGRGRIGKRGMLAAIGVLLPIGLACVSGCTVEPEQTASTESAQTRAEKYTEVRQMTCNVPYSAEQGVRDLANLGGGVSCVASAWAAGAAFVASGGTFAPVSVALVGVGCAGTVIAIHDFIRDRGGSCYSIGVAAESCNATCASRQYPAGQLYFETNQPANTLCGCGTSRQAVQCRKSCDLGFAGPGCECATRPGPDPNDCGMGPSEKKCWLEDRVFATTASGTPVNRRTTCKHFGEFATGKDGKTYECVDCSVRQCVPGSAWALAQRSTTTGGTPMSCPGRPQDNCAALGKIACLGSRSCCWSDVVNGGAGGCLYPGQKSGSAVCQCDGNFPR
jgi:hypothetical protein